MSEGLTLIAFTRYEPVPEDLGMRFLTRGDGVYADAEVDVYGNNIQHSDEFPEHSIVMAIAGPSIIRHSYSSSDIRRAADSCTGFLQTFLRGRARDGMFKGDRQLYNFWRQYPELSDLLPEFPWRMLDHTQGASAHTAAIYTGLQGIDSFDDEFVLAYALHLAETLCQNYDGRWDVSREHAHLRSAIREFYTPDGFEHLVRNEKNEKKESILL